MSHDICDMREKLISWTKEAMAGDASTVDAHELGEVIDMIKDTYQMEYYCSKKKYYDTVTEAMEEYDEHNERFKMSRSGMMRVLPESEYRFDPDEYNIYSRMGYSGYKVAQSEMGRNWDRYLDARRHYQATKSDSDRMEMKKDFTALLQEMN